MRAALRVSSGIRPAVIRYAVVTTRRWPGVTAVWRVPYRLARQNELFLPCSRRNLAS